MHAVADEIAGRIRSETSVKKIESNFPGVSLFEECERLKAAVHELTIQNEAYKISLGSLLDEDIISELGILLEKENKQRYMDALQQAGCCESESNE